MAAVLYYMKGSAGGGNPTALGQDYLDAVRAFADAFNRLGQHRAAMIQQQDDNSGTASDSVTRGNVYGFTDNAGTVSSTTAHAAFAELDSMYSNDSAAILQFCARFKQ